MGITLETFQYFTNKFYDKVKNTFISKEDGVNGIILGQDWELVDSVIANNTVTLPSINTFEEIYIETYSNDATIVHQVSLNKDSLLFTSTNTTHREILIDSLLDVQTYATYSLVDNTITLSSYEGVDVDNTSTTITTKVYVKKISETNGTIPSSRVTFDDTNAQLGVTSLQGAIDEVSSTLSGKANSSHNHNSSYYTKSEVDGFNGLTLSSTLTAGQTTLTFSDARITDNSILDSVYTSKFGVGVSSAEISEGSLVVTFPTQEEDIVVKVVIR